MAFFPFLTALIFLIFPAQTEPQSVVEWLGTTQVEMGEIPQRKPAFVRFPFRNLSSGPLTIDNIRTGCGCTAPEWEDAAVPPGDTSSILIEYDAAKPGYFKQWIRVYFHGQRKAERLWIEGEVIE